MPYFLCVTSLNLLGIGLHADNIRESQKHLIEFGKSISGSLTVQTECLTFSGFVPKRRGREISVSESQSHFLTVGLLSFAGRE